MSETRSRDAATKLGRNKEETQTLAKRMNTLLANYQVHYQRLRNFHWNVKGDDFYDLHENFEAFYNKAIQNIDEIAERIRVFGHTPLSRFKDYLEESTIEEASTDLEGKEMTKEILGDFQTLTGFLAAVSEEAEKVGDKGTADLTDSITREMEKDHWMLSSWAGEKA